MYLPIVFLTLMSAVVIRAQLAQSATPVCETNADCGDNGVCRRCDGCFIHRWPCCGRPRVRNRCASVTTQPGRNKAVVACKAGTRTDRGSCRAMQTTDLDELERRSFAVPGDASSCEGSFVVTASAKSLQSGRALLALKLNALGRRLLCELGSLNLCVAVQLRDGLHSPSTIKRRISLIDGGRC